MKSDNDLKEKQNELMQETIMEEGQLEQDSFSDNNVIQKKEKENQMSFYQTFLIIASQKMFCSTKILSSMFMFCFEKT